MNPILSFIVPTFNRSNTLVHCINSVLESPLDNFEIIIIDDFSNDDTFNIVNSFPVSSGIIRYFKNSENLGVSYSRNIGLGLAKGQWVCFLDSDDQIIGPNFSTWFNNCLSFQADIYIAKYTVNSKSVNISDFNTSEWQLINCENLVASYMQAPVGNSILTYVWAKIYNLDFINLNYARFKNDLLVYEDLDFNAHLLKASPKILYSTAEIYNYSLPSSPSLCPIKSPLGFIVGLDKLTSCISDQEIAKFLRKKSNDYFLVKSIFIELKKRNPIILWKFLSISNQHIKELQHKNILNKYLRFICRIGLQKNTVTFFLALLIIFKFQ